LDNNLRLTTGCASAEAAIALRQRLNETVEQLDKLRKEHAELEVKFESHDKELTIARSDREQFSFALRRVT
jgi:chromosome segregation ATPase